MKSEPLTENQVRDEVKRHLQQAGFVSFDFWDTLVLRNIDAQEVRLLAAASLVEHFKMSITPGQLLKVFNSISSSLRILAEQVGFNEEYSLEVAWHYVAAVHFDGPEMRKVFRESAIQFEIEHAVQFCRPGIDIRDLLQEPHHSSRISLISDFEGDSSYLQKIGSRLGVALPATICVSSKHLTTKHAGGLFNVMFPDETHRGNVLHVGDNAYSDGLMARQSGCESLVLQLNPVVQKRPHSEQRLKRPPFRMALRKSLELHSALLGHFVDGCISRISNGDSVIFAGSEGAFLSQALSPRLQNDVTQVCINLGRKVFLEKIVILDPDWVFARLLLERLPASHLTNFGPLASLAESKKKSVISYALFSPWQLFEITSEMSQEMKHDDPVFKLQNSLSKLDTTWVVDIGYRGTLASCFAKLHEGPVSVLQVLGDQAFRAALPHGSWSAIYFGDERDGGINKPNPIYVETLFGLGPRGPNLSKNLVQHQQKILQGIESRRELLLDANRVESVLIWPSRGLARSILKTQVLEDDLKVQAESALRKPKSLQGVSEWRIGVWSSYGQIGRWFYYLGIKTKLILRTYFRNY